METETAIKFELALPPLASELIQTSTLDEDAQYLRVTLDKAENMKVATGQRLNEMLVGKFDGNREKLRAWYQATVWEGKTHRAWKVVEPYLSVVRHPEKYPDPAAELARRSEAERVRHREHRRAFPGRPGKEQGFVPPPPQSDTPPVKEEAGNTSVCKITDLSPRSVDKAIMAWVATFNSWSDDYQEIGLNLVAPAESTLRSLVELKELLNAKLREDVARLEQENQSLRERLAASAEPEPEPEEVPRLASEPKAIEPQAEQIEQPVQQPAAPTEPAPAAPPPQTMKDREETIEAFEKAGADGLGAWQRQLMRIDAAVVEALTAEGVLAERGDRVRRTQPWLRPAA